MNLLCVMLESGCELLRVSLADVAQAKQDCVSSCLLMNNLRLQIFNAHSRLFEDVENAVSIVWHRCRG